MIPTFEILEFETDFRNAPVRILRKTVGDKTYSQPVREDSSTYAEYLRYTAWVEAGNAPEDFWTQSDEPELLQVSEPKEETTEQPSSTDTKLETDLGE